MSLWIKFALCYLGSKERQNYSRNEDKLSPNIEMHIENFYLILNRIPMMSYVSPIILNHKKGILYLHGSHSANSHLSQNRSDSLYLQILLPALRRMSNKPTVVPHVYAMQ